MTRSLPFLFCCFLILPVTLYGQHQVNPLPELDNAVRNIAIDLSKRIPAAGAQKIALGQWSYRNSIPPLGSYWAVQLTEELTNLPGRGFVLISGGPAGAGGSTGADMMISGEIVEVAGIIRIYTRLIRTGSNTIEGSLHSDFEGTQNLLALLLNRGDGNSSSSSWDAYEVDSREHPVSVEIAAAENGPPVNRTIHDSNDADYFLLIPDRDGALVMETTGDMDTVMYFFDADSDRSLAENDDGGSGENARIRHTVRAGGRYIARIGGYSDSTGSYGFRAYLIEQIRIDPDEYESDDDFASAKTISIGTPQQHSFHSGSDVDWVTFEIRQAGHYTIRARGINSSRLDTYIELYDSNRSYMDENDDGGDDLDAFLRVNLQPGVYYVKVECLDDEPTAPYTILLQAE
ncbi:MAG: DVUA0089 family protein [Spirochaetaceae bacterium]|jgi:hypothetical protein|nr:DVUA0089 family protein [Spirochaetaceae bacterium]